MSRSATLLPFSNRWAVAWTLLAATTLNFLDRQTLSVLAPELQRDLNISSVGYSAVVNSFLIVYSIMYLLSGRIVDFLGTRRGLGYAIIWWSIAQLLHAFATDLYTLCALRALLAFGEAAVIPSSVKAVAEWFQARERGVAVSIFEAGLSLGPMLAPPIVVWIAVHQGWRNAFLYTGVAGFVVAIFWLARYRTPPELVATPASPAPAGAGANSKSAWRDLLTNRAIWGVAVTRIFGDPVWYFYLFWLPKYFSEAKGLTLASIGAFVWIPYFAQMLGGVFGGVVASRLIHRGSRAVPARYRVMLWSTPVIACGVFSVFSDSIVLAILAVSVGGFALQVWGINVETLPADIFPPERVALGVGLCGMLGGVGGVLFTAATGYMVQHHSYTPVWLLSAALCPIGWLVGWQLLRGLPACRQSVGPTAAPLVGT